MSDSSIFNEYVKTFLSDIEIKIKDNIKKSIVKVSFPSVYRYLADEIRMASIFALIYELNLFRDTGKLNGDTSEDRYKYFEKHIASNEFKEYFFKKYPVLKKLIDLKIDNTVTYIKSIIENLNSDICDIEDKFNIKINSIDDIVLGKGDAHNNGKSVAFLTGDFGKIVYKPHSINNDVIVNKIINISNDKLIHKLRKTLVLDKHGYGWQEYVVFKECESDIKVKEFYYRMGAFLGIFYIMNSGDMHYENIIASGENPVFIDTETLIVNSTLDLNEIPVNKNTQFDSVLSTCLLPVSNSETLIDFDMSGIDGGVLESNKIKTVKIVNFGKDYMKVGRNLLDTKSDERNIPSLNGKKINPKEYISYIKSGFSDFLDIVVSNKNKFLDLVSSIDLESEQRQLFRHTYVYAKFLEVSLNPKYLISYEKRDELFEIFLKYNNSPRVKNEINSLKNGNVPYYYSKFGSRHIFSNGEILVENYYKNSGFDTVTYKIKYLNKEKVLHQEKLIELSFLSKIKNLFMKEKDFVGPKIKLNSSKDLINTIELSVENIVNSEYLNIINNKPDMYMVKLNPNENVLTNINSSLYEGGGELWFLHKYYHHMKLDEDDKKYLDILKRILIQEKEYHSISIYDGISSDIYLLTLMYRETGDIEVYLKLRDTLSRLNKLLNKNENLNFDYMNGISGVVDLIYKLKKYYNFEILDEIMRTIINLMRKFDYEEFNKDIGLAHGMSGVQLSLAILFDLTQDEFFYKKMIYLNEREEESIKSCTEIPKYWCRGYLGMLVSRLKMIDLIKNNTTKAMLVEQSNRYLEEILLFNEYDNMCLCHGIYGLIDTFIYIRKNYKDIFSEEKNNTMERVIDKWSKVSLVNENIDIYAKYGLNYDGFMLGNSGVLYTGLRMINNSIVSLLNMEIE